MSSISREEVAHVARLAQLALSDTELDEYSKQLDSILNHIQAVTSYPCDGEEYTVTGRPISDLRRDEPVESLNTTTILQQAPSVEDGRFAVPQILGSE